MPPNECAQASGGKRACAEEINAWLGTGGAWSEERFSECLQASQKRLPGLLGSDRFFVASPFAFGDGAGRKFHASDGSVL